MQNFTKSYLQSSAHTVDFIKHTPINTGFKKPYEHKEQAKHRKRFSGLQIVEFE